MKIIIIALVCLSGIIGFVIKIGYINQMRFLRDFKVYLEYLLTNISIYKNNLTQINNNYIIMQNNKNAKFDNIFQKNDNLCEFNEKYIKEQIIEEDWKIQVIVFLSNLGKSDKQLECEKIKQMIDCVSMWQVQAEKDVKEKGDLYFKIWLGIGATIGIVLW